MQRRSEIVPLKELTPFPGNARRGDLAILRESLRVHGQYRDVVVQESTGYILAGNHTFFAAREEGITEIGATFIDVDDEQARKIVLVDNRSNDVAGYDIPALADLLQSVNDLEGTGFNDQALEEVMAALGASGFGAHVDVDDAPEVPVEPTTKLGDHYRLGRHSLVCGDCTSVSAVESLLGEAQIDLVFTDPPYNLNYDSGRKGRFMSKSSNRPQHVIMNDNLSTMGFDELLSGSLTNMLSALQPGGSIYMFCDWRHYGQVESMFKNFFNLKNTIVWDKTHFGMGVHYRMQFEMIIFGCNGDKIGTWTAGRNERDVWQQQRENTREYRHVTQKPVEIAERAIKNSSKGGDNVLDLFGGSGTTLIACEGLERTCYMMELAPGYCDVIVARWEKITGQKAVLNEDS